MTWNKAVKKLDAGVAALIKKRDGYVCITCKSRCRGRNRHAGHFRKRGMFATRFNLENVNLQCARCNKWLHGNEGVYAVELDKKYGQGTAGALVFLSGRKVKWPTSYLLRLIEAAKKGIAAYEKEYKDLFRKCLN